MSRHRGIHIISDSLLKDVSLPGLARVSVFRGATLITLWHTVCENRIAVDWDDVSLVIIHAGTNDVDNGDGWDVLRRIGALICVLRTKNRDLNFIVSSILPRPKDFEQTNPTIKRVNGEIRSWARDKASVHFVPTFTTFLQHGKIRTDQILFAADGLHLSEFYGVQRIVRILKNLIIRYQRGQLNFAL